MFKRKFKDEFEFFENYFLYKDENEFKNSDRFIYVVYDKFEMIEFFKFNKRESNILVCIFNRQLYISLAFLEDINNLVLLDGSKTRSEIVKDLKSYFKSRPNPKSELIEQGMFTNSNIFQTQFQDFYKALFSIM